MRLAIAGGLAAAALGAAGLAAADPVELLPGPLAGWTASGPVYGESLIEVGEAAPAGSAPGTRITLSRDYRHSNGSGLRISLNTFDRSAAQLIVHVNQARQADPARATELAVKGVFPFPFGSRQGVVLRQAGSGDMVTGVALRLGVSGTLTLEALGEGAPAFVALKHVEAYLKRMDLDRMEAFVGETSGKTAE